MLESVEWLHLFISNHGSFEYIIIFFGAALGGEVALFALGFLAAQGALSPFSVIILSFFGALFPNIVWFFLGKTDTISKIVLHRYANTTTSMITQAIDKMSKGSHFVALTIIKFTVGTPVLLTMYVSKTDISFRKFLLYQSIAVALSLLVVMPFGFASGYGFVYIASVFDNIYAALGFILFILIIIITMKSSIKKRFTKNIS